MKTNNLWSFTRGYRQYYMIAVTMTLFATIFAYIVPLLISFTIDHVIAQKQTSWVDLQQFFIDSGLWIISCCLVCLALAEGLFNFARSYFAQKAAEGVARDLRENLYNHIQHLHCNFYSTNETGDLIQRCTSDVETVRRFLAMHIPEMGRSFIMVVVVVPIMLSLNVAMTFISLIAVPLIFFFAVVFFSKMQKIFKLTDEAEANMTSTIQENLTASRVVRAFARKEHEVSKFCQKNSTYRDHLYGVLRLIALYWSISDLICLLQIAGVLVVGSWWTMTGTLSLGTLFAFMTYESMLLWPIRHMGRILADFGKTTVAAQRIAYILDYQPELDHGTNEVVEGDIHFCNVSFAYEGQDMVLRNIDLHIKKGQTVAILGATGAGKSTLVKLLLRLHKVSEGKITVGGHDINDIDRKKLRENIGIVLQNPFLYSKTIYENLLWGNLEASEEQVYKAAETASIHNTIENLEEGYRTELGERGVTLSGGQKQRTAIARTLLRETPILVFDDSFSAVDTNTENNILQSLRKRTERKTTIIIAHRLSTVMNADWIIFLEDGCITQQGTHSELIQVPGAYQRIWKMQYEEQLDILQRVNAPPYEET